MAPSCFTSRPSQHTASYACVHVPDTHLPCLHDLQAGWHVHMLEQDFSFRTHGTDFACTGAEAIWHRLALPPGLRSIAQHARVCACEIRLCTVVCLLLSCRQAASVAAAAWQAAAELGSGGDAAQRAAAPYALAGLFDAARPALSTPTDVPSLLQAFTQRVDSTL